MLQPDYSILESPNHLQDAIISMQNRGGRRVNIPNSNAMKIYLFSSNQAWDARGVAVVVAETKEEAIDYYNKQFGGLYEQGGIGVVELNLRVGLIVEVLGCDDVRFQVAD